MPTPFTRCQFISQHTQTECDNWYPYEEGQRFCPNHRLQNLNREDNNTKPVSALSNDRIQQLNDKVAQYQELSIPEIVEHIRNIESKIKELEFDRRAATIAKRNLEDRLTEEERANLREASKSYGKVEEISAKPKKIKSLEEKAKNRKEGFSAWAARLGMKNVEELMLMDDEEVQARIAKYKASKR